MRSRGSVLWGHRIEVCLESNDIKKYYLKVKFLDLRSPVGLSSVSNIHLPGTNRSINLEYKVQWIIPYTMGDIVWGLRIEEVMDQLVVWASMCDTRNNK